ncbi:MULTISPECIES: GreA/GreB family elongation factor [Streptomyces]|uniref:Transcription elongation factor, putative n=1 Tax=Streptomyces venezuelae (strain ATCC 10712 / CBS 650.69 / DSM 40230 / JCM 4526 / NBRC 13096 / PD 04745) TaxID=953739 RepID=F2RG98_STRVP|nr:GreA/GreB family elongation factor [Streptomyces venezuelae]APE25239.1 nucleoside diphosphate kinase regulator [Streptomyces venezuelae]QES02579.1 nucleoside diphosphate kinase regulator [Streptomyces venezuelae ATCC 10712]CCA59818.1 transcription elongation factor, putative [Streptomyces venezuelae ATCC 10712]
MTGGPEPISAAAREALERELDELRTEREAVAVTLRDGGGDETGDRADQADELQRGTELTRLDRRIDELHGRLREAAVAGAPRTDAVGVGSTVTVRFEDGTETTVQIGEVAAVLDATMVTADSPLGGALLGHRAGDTVTYVTPQGRTTAVVVSLGD